MLAEHPSTFSEILESISIDSGHLSYHLENLGELIRKPQGGKYELSSIGTAAVRLMGGVEEHQTRNSSKDSRMRLSVMNVFPLILVGALIGASFFFVNFTASLRVDGFFTSPGTFIHVRPGQTFAFNITLVYATGAEQHILANDSLYHERPYPISTLTVWEEGHFWFDLKSNGTYSIAITVFHPDGSNATSREDNQAPGTLISGLGATSLSQPGEYVFEIKNVGFQDLLGVLAVNEWWQFFERSWFYYGIAGLLLAVPYPVWVLFRLLKKSHA